MSMKGYKAFNKDLTCRGYQFVIGEWAFHEGPLEPCKSGFHFCEQPSGPWAYYTGPNTRIFEVEAEDVMDVRFEPGADFKRVCRRLRLIKEIFPTGEGNAGNRNAGNRNTGEGNAGNWNAGEGNATNNSSGFFCMQEPTVLCFDVETNLSRQNFCKEFPEYKELASMLNGDAEIEFEMFKRLPGITPEKLSALHRAFKSR